MHPRNQKRKLICITQFKKYRIMLLSVIQNRKTGKSTYIMKAVVFIMKLLSKYSNILGSILIGVLLSLIVAFVFLSNSESPAFPYQVNLIIFSYALYEILKPLHELGHYYTAKKYAEKQSYAVNFCMRFGEISCSNWKVYTDEECKDILLSGSALKILCCMLIAFLLFIKESFLFPIPLYTAAFEYISNMTTVLPRSEGNDISKYKNVQLLYNEEVNMKPTNMDVFIRVYYDPVLVVFMVFLFPSTHYSLQNGKNI